MAVTKLDTKMVPSKHFLKMNDQKKWMNDMDIIETLNVIGYDIIILTINQSLECAMDPSPGFTLQQWGNKMRKKLYCAHYPLPHPHLTHQGHGLLLQGVHCLRQLVLLGNTAKNLGGCAIYWSMANPKCLWLSLKQMVQAADKIRSEANNPQGARETCIVWSLLDSQHLCVD